jgi:hypothetical protein
MKKTLVAALLGVSAAVTAYGQGQLAIANYLVAPYNQVYFVQGGQAVRVNTVQVQVWFAEGTIVDQNLLTQGITMDMAVSGGSFSFDPGAGHGAGGYFVGAIQPLPTWATGDVFTFQLRAIGAGVDTVASRSVLWTQQSEIASSLLPANLSSVVPGLGVVIPEPTTFALAGLGSAALLIFRRRRS